MIRLAWGMALLGTAAAIAAVLITDLLVQRPSSLIQHAWARWCERQDQRLGLGSYEPQPEDEAATTALEAWLAGGDPLADAPAREMGVWLTPDQADDLDLLAVETWPRNEYLEIADLYMRGEAP